MHSNRLHTSGMSKKKRRRQLRRVKPKPGTLQMLLLLLALIAVVIIFMPVSRVVPAVNLSGTEVSLPPIYSLPVRPLHPLNVSTAHSSRINLLIGLPSLLISAYYNILPLILI